MSLNAILFAALLVWYLLQNSSPYKKQATILFVKYFQPDQCVVKPWSEKKYNPKQWKKNYNLMDVCTSPEFIEKNKVTLSALIQFAKIQYTDRTSPVYMNNAFSSTVFDTDHNLVLFDGKQVLYDPVEVYTNTTGKIECTNVDFQGKPFKFTTRRPYRVSYMDEKFQRQEVDFYSGKACFLADYFN